MKRLFSVLMVGAILLFASMACAGTSVTLEWDANTETDLAGYKMYYKVGPSGGAPYDGTGAVEGDSPIDIVGNVATFTFSNLLSGTYWFVVSAYDTEGLESDYSNEVTATLNSLAPSAPKNLIIKVKVIVSIEHP